MTGLVLSLSKVGEISLNAEFIPVFFDIFYFKSKDDICIPGFIPFQASFL